MRQALLTAQRSVFIAGWDIDSRTRLVGPSGKAEDDLPERLGPFLSELIARRPELQIHLLLWDYSMLYALEREPLPAINLDWNTPARISVCLDDVLPVGASHHQKIVVIDDVLAFCGGIDLTIRRWDTPAHTLDNETRTDPSGEPYRPFHDIQMMADGEVALALGELLRDRWRTAACETPIAVKPAGDAWPDDVTPDFTDIDIAIARTIPAYDGAPEIREVEALYRRSIESAERSLYIECQYLTVDGIADCLARRMQEKPELEAVIVSPNVHHSWLEENSMNAGRRRVTDRLKEAGVWDRIRFVYPALADDSSDQGVMVHAKLMIVDDIVLRVGSSNLNNRSMGMDSECDLALVAADTEQREAIAGIRNRLLAEHLGTDKETVAAALEKHESFLSAVESLAGDGRTLRPIDLSQVSDDAIAETVGAIADPEKPIATPNFVGDLFGGTERRDGRGRLVKILALAIGLLGFVALWRYTPLSALTDVGQMVEWVRQRADLLWMPALVPAAFVLGGLVAFPVTVMIAAAGIVFSPLAAFAYALGGSLLSATVTFLIGHAIGRGPLRPFIGPKVNLISRSLARQGIVSISILRMVPIAPFTVINLVAGASHIRFADFLIGTILGMAPGILVISLLGRQLGETLSNPSPMEMVYLGAGIAGWLLLSLALQRAARALRAGSRNRQDG